MIQTERLLLRPWRDEDREPFAAMNADPRVMEYFLSTLSKDESDAIVDRQMKSQEENGFCMFAAETNGEFIGFIGLQTVSFDTGYPPADEIGWRLAPHAWGKGYATEGAKACLDFAWNELQRERIVSFTAVQNRRSRNVMEKIGMHEVGFFGHPRVPVDHPIHQHVLYEINRDA